MFNVGGGEFLIIFLIALVVLGPTKLPEVARQVGKVVGEFRRISSGFQREIKSAMDDPVARATGQTNSPTANSKSDVTRIAEPSALSNEPSVPDPEAVSPSTSATAPDSDATTEKDGDGPDAPMFGDR
ncbi:MAG: sec-independent protein translocase protein TatB [Verrucomicrobiales bacterium]|jgi:sec-independent protein translocase protein TatB